MLGGIANQYAQIMARRKQAGQNRFSNKSGSTGYRNGKVHA